MIVHFYWYILQGTYIGPKYKCFSYSWHLKLIRMGIMYVENTSWRVQYIYILSAALQFPNNIPFKSGTDFTVLFIVIMCPYSTFLLDELKMFISFYYIFTWCTIRPPTYTAYTYGLQYNFESFAMTDLSTAFEQTTQVVHPFNRAFRTLRL